MTKRIILNGLNTKIISLKNHPEIIKDNIKHIWTLYDLDEVLNYAAFHPHTGEKVTSIENAFLKHNHGVFLEDYVHDWNLVDDGLYIYSRVIKANNPITLIVEMK